jgi:tetratricopeptide (TPR) repeat protein
MSWRTFIGVLAASLALAVPATVRADDASAPEPPSLSDDTSDALQKLQPMLDAKNWSAALDLLNGLLPGLDPTSYDEVVILDIKARIYLQQDDLQDVVGPWERALTVSDQHKYFSAHNTLDIVDGLGRVYYQLSGTVKDPDLQKADLDKSIGYMRRWLSESPKPTEDAVLGLAEVLYNKAVADPAKIDQPVMDEAVAAVHKGLLMSIHPKIGFYEILIASMQMRGDLPGLAKYLEYLVTVSPTNRGYWDALAGTYINLANANEKDPYVARGYFARAINTVERAQALGLLDDPTHNYNLASMYYEAGQTGMFTKLLDAGLASGGIKSTVDNWGRLAYCYQLDGDNTGALDALKRAEAAFPEDGDFDFKISQIYAQLDDTENAYAYSKLAVSKPKLEKPYGVYLFLAYNAFQLKKLDEAEAAVDEAATFPEAVNNKDLPRLRSAIQDAVTQKQIDDEAKAKAAQAAAGTDAAPDAAPEQVNP